MGKRLGDVLEGVKRTEELREAQQPIFKDRADAGLGPKQSREPKHRTQAAGSSQEPEAAALHRLRLDQGLRAIPNPELTPHVSRFSSRKTLFFPFSH